MAQLTKGETKKTTDLRMLLALSTYIRPHRMLLLLGGVFFILLTGTQLVRPLIIKEVIDNAFVNEDGTYVFFLAKIYFAVLLLAIVSNFIQGYALKYFGQHIIYEIRNDLFRSIIGRSKDSFDSHSIGTLVTNITSDTESIRSLFTDVLLKLINAVLLLLGVLGFLYYLNFEMGILVTILIPLVGYLTIVYGKYSRKAFRGVRKQIAETNAYVQNALNFVVIIKTYLGEKLMAKRHTEISDKLLAAGLFEVRTFAFFRPIMDSLYLLCIVLIFSYVHWLHPALEAGLVYATIQYVEKIFEPLKEISDKYNVLQQSLAGAERIIPLLEKQKKEKEHVEIPRELLPVERIEFDQVSFAYELEKPVLENISFTIHAGDFVGIVGPSGSGKSTLMSLLMAFQRPTSGTIYINGYDMKNYPSEVMRELIGFVFQDSHLFKGTIRDNLCLYEPDLEDEVMIRATKKAHLHNMIERLPKGYLTEVGYLGSLLSAGQRQLLSLARALIKDKPILIFDEATSHIDSETERLVQESIEKERGEKTIFSIAHRLSTIQKADTILFIKNGHLLEAGSFVSLMQEKGEFYELWNTLPPNKITL